MSDGPLYSYIIVYVKLLDYLMTVWQARSCALPYFEPIPSNIQDFALQL
jgi:hypothetical protein